MNKKEKKIRELYEEVRVLRYNKGFSIKNLSEEYGKSERTIYRWINHACQGQKSGDRETKTKKYRGRKYSHEIFDRIVELKEEVPQRSSVMIHRRIQEEFKGNCPSLSTIQKFIHDQGLVFTPKNQKQGYIKFQRQKPNDLWQVDVAGVQTVGYLKKLYLIALIDDCSRFIVAAEYFRDQKGINVIKIIRDAINSYGRPNQILADNGTQFRNVIGELGTKYSRCLEFLGITPIFAKPNHPQTKGKLERWFRTVHHMFLSEARHHLKTTTYRSLAEFNEEFKEWVGWYNTEKPHQSLPDKVSPAKIFFDTKNRIFRPLRVTMNWDRWLNEITERKVNKYNQISYKAQNFDVPPGYVRSKIEVIEYEDKLELYFKDRLLITHPYRVPLNSNKSEKIYRKIRKNGTISYQGKWFTVDYKLAGKTVEVQETNDGQTLLIYLNDVLITRLNR